MARYNFRVGLEPDDGTGDDARTVGVGLNNNFIELYAAKDAWSALNLTPGVATKLPPDANPTISLSGVAPNLALNLGLPQGPAGDGAPTSADILAGARYMGLVAKLAALEITAEPGLAMMFDRGSYFCRGRYLGASIRSLIAACPGSTFTRSTVAWYFDAEGVLRQAPNHEPRLNTDPVTGRTGFLLEPTSINRVPNPTGSGGTPGSPGTPPTGWDFTIPPGLNRTLSFGTEAGMAFVDVGYSGTPTTAENINIGCIGTTQVAAAAGQTWTGSFYVALKSGAIPECSLGLVERGSSGTWLTSSPDLKFTPVAGALNRSRFVRSRTFARAETAYATHSISIPLVPGVAVDFVMRLGCPQLEQTPYATSPILSGGAPTARGIDNVFRINAVPNNGANEGTFLSIVDQLGDPGVSMTRHIGLISDDLGSSASTIVTTTPPRVYGYSNLNNEAKFSAPTRDIPSGRVVHALGYSQAGFAYSANGDNPSMGAAVNAIGPYTGVRINTGPAISVRGMIWWPRRLTDSQLQAVTNPALWS